METIIEEMETIGNWLLTIVAIVVSFLSLRKASKALSLEEKREKDRIKEQRKAKLTASFGRVHQLNFIRITLQINNYAEVEARDVEIIIDDQPFLDHQIIRPDKHEIKSIGPKSTIEYNVNKDKLSNGPFTIQIKWSDDSGEEGIYRSTLTL